MGEADNNTLADLDLGSNKIEGVDGGRYATLLLQRFRALKVFKLSYNHLGPLGAGALVPGVAAAACQLESLELRSCRLENDGMANLIPDGQVNRSLTHLDFRGNNVRGNNIRGFVGGENIIALAARCRNLDSIAVDEEGSLNPDQRRRLDLLLDRKRLVKAAQALAGSTFPVLFQFVEKAHRHENGLGAIFVILQNDGDDHFCHAHNRAMIE
jgi:Leucine Rich repeat